MVLCLPVSVLADDAAHTASAKKLIDILNIYGSYIRTVEDLRPSMLSQYVRFIDKENGEEALLAVSYSHMQTKILTDFYHSEKVKNATVDFYKKSFTIEELDAAVEFYQTPVGQKLINELPQLQQKLQLFFASEVNKLQPQAERLMVDFKKDLKRLRDAQS